jgi:glycosyltransferase involved in cell wall biosynthesis
MTPSLTFVLPVHNAERTLADNLADVLDVLADLTERFEVLLVDEGSTDHTTELAHDLAVQYPQLRVARRRPGDPPASVLQAGLSQTNGDVVLVQNRHARFSPSYLRQMWERGAGNHGVIGRIPSLVG